MEFAQDLVHNPLMPAPLQTLLLTVIAGGIVVLLFPSQMKLHWLPRIVFALVLVVFGFYAVRYGRSVSISTPIVSKIGSEQGPPAPIGLKTSPITQTEITAQPAVPEVKQPVKVPALASPQTNGVSTSPAVLEDPTESCRALCAEVVYEGPTAADDLINPGDAMAKELNNAGFQVLLGMAASESDLQPLSIATRRPVMANPSKRETIPRPRASGATVEEILAFIHADRHSEWRNEPEPRSVSPSLSTLLYAMPIPVRGLVVIAVRASMQHLNETNGIFSTEANMEIADVVYENRKIQSIVLMAGPEMDRGFGLDWARAEESALKEISTIMCPPFAQNLRRKLEGER
jgi:hypothetical protein